jgi:hypothetical protein
MKFSGLLDKKREADFTRIQHNKRRKREHVKKSKVKKRKGNAQVEDQIKNKNFTTEPG